MTAFGAVLTATPVERARSAGDLRLSWQAPRVGIVATMDTSSPAPAGSGTIVVGIDGSPSADLALAWAARQAEVEHRALTIVHACGPLHPVWLSAPTLDLTNLRTSTAQHAATTMRAATDWVRANHPGLQVHEVLSEEDPRQELIERATTAATVVVGSRGLGPVRTLLLGSVSVAVSTHALCPVVVIRPATDAADAHPTLGPGGSAGVLVGVLAAVPSLPVLEHAFHLASSRALPITVLQCFWDARLDEVTPGTPDTHLGQVVAGVSAKFPEVEVTTRQEHGFLDRWLIDLSPGMDAVVLASHHPSLVHRAVYGSSARTVLEHATGVLVVVPLLSDHHDTGDDTAASTH